MIKSRSWEAAQFVIPPHIVLLLIVMNRLKSSEKFELTTTEV